ncbi:MAG: ABC transporter permease [Gemmatimonadota bacterium]|jgi:predicted permease
MDSWLGDFRLALRSLRQRPLFTLVVVASLGVGLGVVTAVFSVANSLLLRSVGGVSAPDRAVEIGRTTGGRGFDTFSWPEYTAMRESASPLSAVAGWTFSPLSFGTGGEGERANGLLVSAPYFDAAGVAPALGRFFAPGEDAFDEGSVAVLSHDFWRDRFGSDPAVIGRVVSFNRHAFTVIGIAPADFLGHSPMFSPDVYLPLGMIGVASPRFDRVERDDPRASWFSVIGRLAPGATIAQADAAVKAAVSRFAPPDVDPGRIRSARVIPLGPVPGGFGRAGVTAFLSLMLGVALLVMVIACANVAGMLTARASARDREMAIRLALGSGRFRLARQLLTEALVLFAAGGVVAIALTYWSGAVLNSIHLPVPIPLRLDFSPDALVLGAGLTMALITGLVFGIAPAMQAGRGGSMVTLRKDSARPGSRGSRARRLFLGAQLALSVVLLVSAGLFLRSLQSAAGTHIGFDAHAVETLMLDLSLEGYDAVRGPAFQARLLERLRAMPGVSDAALAVDLPLDLGSMGTPVKAESGPASGEQGMGSEFNRVSAGYFEALRIALLEGRAFDAGDIAGAEPVAIVSRTLAERAWPGESVIGKRIQPLDGRATWRTVVGVVDDVKNQMLAEATGPLYYTPLAQDYDPAVNVIVRGAGGPGLGRAMEAALHELDPQLSLTPAQSLEAVTAVGLLPQRMGAGVTSGLGLLALLLSALGVYGVIAFTVAQRTFEIGVRAALGARRADIIRLVLGGAFRLAIPGLAIGIIAAFALGRAMRSFILGVAPADPVTFIAMPALLLLAVGMASLIPARRAAAVPPMTALRTE